MPPQRTFPPVKPVKTERTHEENQERAYIAASRRSDRSLEARVESARRASEIHKRRTGRSLRVTEQDVINEEMYEEEDDDLPASYRRLTAHLQTNSADFNRRLAAYLAGNVGTRSALYEALSGNFLQHYPNAPQFAHNNSMFPSPIVTQGFVPQAQQQMQQQPMQSPSAVSPHTPHPYRHAPYPMPGQQQYRPSQQQRASSIQIPSNNMQAPQHMSPTGPATPGAHMSSQQIHAAFRRASMPAQPGVVYSNTPTNATPQQLPSPKSDTSPRAPSPAELSKPGSAPASVVNGPVGQPQLQQPQPQYPQPPQLLLQQHSQQAHQFTRQARPHGLSIPNDNLAPFTMSLPPNDAALINASTLPSNDFSAALMANHNWDPSSFEGFGASDPGAMFKPGANFHPNMAGMNSTLAPEDMLKGVPGSFGDALGQNVSTPNGFDMTAWVDFGNQSNGPSAEGSPGEVGGSFGDFVHGGWANENPT